MAKLGRPKLPKRERNGKILGVRFTIAERRMLDDVARAAGVSLSDWSRNVLLAQARSVTGEETMVARSNPTGGVPHGARTTEVDGRVYWMEQTRGEPRPQVTVVDADAGEIQGYFYPIRPGYPHVSFHPAEASNGRQTEIVNVIANRFSGGI